MKTRVANHYGGDCTIAGEATVDGNGKVGNGTVGRGAGSGTDGKAVVDMGVLRLLDVIPALRGPCI